MASETTGTARDVARLADGPEVRRRCARSTARRLVGGAGSLDVVAYRQERPALPRPLAHGRTAGGDWLVVLPGPSGDPSLDSFDSPDLLDSLDPSGQAEVRIQVDQLGAPSGLRVQLASLHALGTLRMLSPEEAARRLVDGATSEVLGAAVQAPGARVGLLAVDSVLVHAREDVEKLSWSEVVAGGTFPMADQEWDALDAVAALDDAVVARLLDELAQGVRRGIIGRAVVAAQEHLAAAGLGASGGIAESVDEAAAPVATLLDVDAEGCTWLVRDGGTVRSVLLAFERPVRDVAELQEALRLWCAAG